jgi:hypothetical protein
LLITGATGGAALISALLKTSIMKMVAVAIIFLMRFSLWFGLLGPEYSDQGRAVTGHLPSFVKGRAPEVSSISPSLLTEHAGVAIILTL